MAKYLDTTGVTYLWNKIKNKFVAKVDGKGLSTNDFTNDEKTKLGSMPSNVQEQLNGKSPSNHKHSEYATNWDDLDDKPFDDTTLIYKNDSMKMDKYVSEDGLDYLYLFDANHFGLEAGKDYIVIIDGVEYTSTCSTDGSRNRIGDFDTQGFRIIEYLDGRINTTITTQESATSIEVIKNEIKHLDSKYIQLAGNYQFGVIGIQHAHNMAYITCDYDNDGKDNTFSIPVLNSSGKVFSANLPDVTIGQKGMMLPDDKMKLDAFKSASEYALKTDLDTKIGNVTAVAGANINSVGTPSVSVKNENGTSTLTFNYLKGAKGDKGDRGERGEAGINATTTNVATQTANGLMSKEDKIKLDNFKSEAITYTLQLIGNQLRLVGSDGSISSVTLPTSGGTGISATDDGNGNVFVTGATVTDNDGNLTIGGANATDSDGNIVIG